MGFLDKFKRKKYVQKKAFPTRALHLKVQPLPENGRELSSHFIDAVREIEGVDLPLEVESIKYVDDFLENYRQQYDVDDFAETIFVAGCFVGEVMVEKAGARWINSSDADLPESIKAQPLVIQLPNGSVCFPIQKAFKRFGNGNGDSLAYFYYLFTKIDDEKTEMD